ncbi:D-threonate kinase [Gilliamella apis]|uniref:D-threonate kinase n=1 Tax=Gilliamella apis TaxID=1970738 RepID=UPI0027423701|nr:four-carbon acid sugar kinase family protein [Gilliamella apis]WLT07538.1 four-carbon acid sugar kinase family protein [Gilliamella apis]
MVRLIIADDFTGSNDAGVQFVKKGFTVDVVFDWQSIQPLKTHINDKKVMVVNTESRAIEYHEAQNRIKQVVLNNRHLQPIYKKIDSTLRGNIGGEIETLLATTQIKFALVIPAFPNMNRITKNGKCYVNGIELINTEFATDPKTPICSSHIKTIIKQQTDYPCEEINIDKVRTHQIAKCIENFATQGIKIIIIDAETNHDLKTIIEQTQGLLDKVLLVGSAGLVEFLSPSMTEKTPKSERLSKKPMLVMAGSMSEITQQQINYTIQHDNNWNVIDLKISDLLPELSATTLITYKNKIQEILDNNQHCIVRTSTNKLEREKIDLYCQQYQLSRTELGEKICSGLGLLVKNIKFNNLFLTGGDVAISIAKSLGAIGFTIEGQVCEGVPYGRLLSHEILDYKIFTKAGGFGTKDIFLKALRFI